ncbi:hypothetical protein PANDA_000164 [Ailuropoda melanoleuca]|uniref:Uncharacterized protein n=1 Tax=Ailuropoda melanoleuca TaxID=9646 RepID=D2GU70_AILME|nr:hypothetical protein PANDA_000164 [Ailuropoda melanoleuca]
MQREGKAVDMLKHGERNRERDLGAPSRVSAESSPRSSDRISQGRGRAQQLAERPLAPVHTHPTRGARALWFRKLADFRLFLPPRHFEGISAAFMDRLGHQLEDMLLSCKYRGELCGPHNFSSVHRTPGNCPVTGVKGWDEREARLTCGFIVFGKTKRKLCKKGPSAESHCSKELMPEFQNIWDLGGLWRKRPEYEPTLKL